MKYDLDELSFKTQALGTANPLKEIQAHHINNINTVSNVLPSVSFVLAARKDALRKP